MWEDQEGLIHRIEQGEGEEQGDVLMPLLFSLGQHAALKAVQERLFAFLNDIYVVTTPGRLGHVCSTLNCNGVLPSRSTLARHKCGMREANVHKGAIYWRCWPRRSECGAGLESGLPMSEQGIRVRLVRVVRPEWAQSFAERHTAGVWRCLASIHCPWADRYYGMQFAPAQVRSGPVGPTLCP